MDDHNTQIKSSSFSDEFKMVMQIENIKTIADLLALSKEQLISIPGFSFQMLIEYRSFLKENNLEAK